MGCIMLVPNEFALVVVEWHGRGRIVKKGYKSNMLNAARAKGLQYRVVRTKKKIGEYVKL